MPVRNVNLKGGNNIPYRQLSPRLLVQLALCAKASPGANENASNIVSCWHTQFCFGALTVTAVGALFVSLISKNKDKTMSKRNTQNDTHKAKKEHLDVIEYWQPELAAWYGAGDDDNG